MLRKTEGIVLRTIPFGEADLIVSYITRDLGILKAFAKSPRKTKSRFGSSLEPFTHSLIGVMGREDAPLPRLTQSDIVRPHQGLRETLRTMVALSSMAELTLALMPEAAPSEPAFRLMQCMLDLMDAAPDNPLYPLTYAIRLLALKGYAPALGGCAVCGAASNEFYPSMGALACRVCRREGPSVRLAQGSIKLYFALAEWEPGKLTRLKASAGMQVELRAMLDAHLGHVLTRPMKTPDTIDALRKL